MTLTEYLGKQSKSVLLYVGMLLFAFVTVADYLARASYLMEFFVLYLIPVSFFSWFIGKRSGMLFALLSLTAGEVIRLAAAPRAAAYWEAVVWVTLYVSSVLMIAQLKALYERERYLSRIDPLTLARNRRAFLESAAWAKSFCERHDSPLSIAYLDVDDFKELNDRGGHAMGDKLLATVAVAIQKALRPTDVVARIGGDEFAVLLPETNGEIASRILIRLRLELDEAMRQQHWPTTFSIGLVSFSPPLGSVEGMIQTADAAMYAAKSKGKNQVEQRSIAV